jgi:hypothetical protein
MTMPTRLGARVLQAHTATERRRGRCPCRTARRSDRRHRRCRRRRVLPRGGPATRRRPTGRPVTTRFPSVVVPGTMRTPRRPTEGAAAPGPLSRVATSRRAKGSRRRRTPSLVDRDRRTGRPEWPRGNKNQSYAQDQRTQKGYVSTQQGSLIADHRTIAVTIKRKDLPGLATISSTGKLFRSLVERTGAKVRTAAGRARCKNLPKSVGTVPSAQGGACLQATTFPSARARQGGFVRRSVESGGKRTRPQRQRRVPANRTSSPSLDAGVFEDWASTGNQPSHVAQPNNYQHRRANARNKGRCRSCS